MPNNNSTIYFSTPFKSSHEIQNLKQVVETGFVHGDGPFTQSASKRLSEITGASKVLLTTSGTDALEMAVRLVGVGYGDEVIVPSFTFSSGASSIVAAGATPVFVDIEGDTGNVDPNKVLQAITPATKAISVMHYGGQPVDMTSIMKIASENGLKVIEDNAHGLGVKSKQGMLGTIGDVAIQSFHDTKNVHCGEGGAVLINNLGLVETAEIMREKGTNRSKFLRGQVDKYTWVEWGSSFLPSELNAAVLDSQLESFHYIQERRFEIWNKYQSSLTEWACQNGRGLMNPTNGIHAAHVFYVTLSDSERRDGLLSHLKERDVIGTFHYVPLHSSPAGKKYGRVSGDMGNTDSFSSRLVRLPLWPAMSVMDTERVIESVLSYEG